MTEHQKSISYETKNKLAELIQKRICKIECQDEVRGLGFFCKVPNSDKTNYLKAMITTNGVLSKKDISNGKTIKLSLNEGSKTFEIKIENNRKAYTSEENDLTIIEIKDEDGLENNSFFEIDVKIFTNSYQIIFKSMIIF